VKLGTGVAEVRC